MLHWPGYSCYILGNRRGYRTVHHRYNIDRWWYYPLYKLEQQDRVIFAQIGVASHIFKFYNPTNYARCLNVTAYFGLSDVYSALASDNFHYLHGYNCSSNSVLVKIDPTDDNYIALLLSTGEYYIYNASLHCGGAYSYSSTSTYFGIVYGSMQSQSIPPSNLYM